ncbi:hypothetical protein MKW94_014170 [Papaver nudicaule]|uniref:Macro domain-containing protein n=1 Tax=Papaver nudicaule TaxID=74823 RepID=A0AA41UXL1_PAPNU|nr:hypothetical protein [Papaver nudicaule]
MNSHSEMASKDDEIDENKVEYQKSIVVVLVGAPGTGSIKSTFCDHVMKSSLRSWVQVCQNSTAANGEGGAEALYLKKAIDALKGGKSVLIDTCNLELEQFSEFRKLGSPRVDVHVVVFNLTAWVSISQSLKCTDNEGQLKGGKPSAAVSQMLQMKELPKLNEGFSRITFCLNESDVREAINMYGDLGPLDTLPSGCFGQISVDSSTGPPTLVFPSISTAYFQFDPEIASDIIVEKVEEFLDKIGNGRLVLVDLTPGSSILNSVKVKATQRNIDSDKFFTFVGDITQLYTKGGLRCNVIANTTNCLLKPGGGGVNEAIFNAAGPALEIATKEVAAGIGYGSALTVPLPSTSPLYIREGVTHVIHVLGPNMNPLGPDCLNNDYDKGCQILREAYSSLFESFASIVRTIATEFSKEPSESQSIILSPHSDRKGKRGAVFESGRNKKLKGPKVVYSEPKIATGVQLVSESNDIRRSSQCGYTDATGIRIQSERDGICGGTTKVWEEWAHSLHHRAKDPVRYNQEVIEILDDVVVLYDLYPKARRHLLVVLRKDGLDRLADVRKEHLPLLKIAHAVGVKWAMKFIFDEPSLVFRLGYHSDPSMRQLHLHVISQDFDSARLKKHKHWNIFNTAFFRDSADVIEEIEKHGQANLYDDESLMSAELRCNRCKSAHRGLSRLKSHIRHCRAPFPSSLIQNGYLLVAPSGAARGT